MYRLPDTDLPLEFPDDFETFPEGLLALGGNLHPQTLINAYAKGIFPWYSKDDPLLWWHPDPRMVLFPNHVYVSTKTRKILKRGDFTTTANAAFGQVIRECASKRGKNRDDTWIQDEIIAAYEDLHRLRFAQSVEVWDKNKKLVGGIYGVCLGGIFFGESMFSHADNASKIALIRLCELMEENGILLLDCQVESEHLKSMGSTAIPREKFLSLLQKAKTHEKRPGPWF
jgi:leucyl/phenylalanyl-tRNA--protein transferase